MRHPLADWRARHGLSQDRFAVIAKSTGPTICRVETGATVARVGTLRQLAAATRQHDPTDCVSYEALAAWAELASEQAERKEKRKRGKENE